MNITKADVAEFQALYKARTGNDLDNQAAYEKLTKLVRQVEIVYQPITKGQLKDFSDNSDSNHLPQIDGDVG